MYSTLCRAVFQSLQIHYKSILKIIVHNKNEPRKWNKKQTDQLKLDSVNSIFDRVLVLTAEKEGLREWTQKVYSTWFSSNRIDTLNAHPHCIRCSHDASASPSKARIRRQEYEQLWTLTWFLNVPILVRFAVRAAVLLEATGRKSDILLWLLVSHELGWDLQISIMWKQDFTLHKKKWKVL